MKYITNIIRILFLALFIFLLANGKVLLWLALFAVSLVAALIFGRVYCGYACPMNTLMIPTEWLSKKLKLQTADTPKWLKNGYFTWITLGISIAVMLLSKRLLHIDLPILPFGALQRSFGRFARLSQKVDKDACVGCKLCEKACPSNAIVVSSEDKKAVINTALCHQCIKCRQVCPKDAIHYKK